MKKQNKITYIEFEEDIENKIPSFKLNLAKATGEESFAIQVLGYFPSMLIFGIVRLDEIIECSDIDKLLRNDKKEFLNNELRKKAFCNMTGASMEDLNNAKG